MVCHFFSLISEKSKLKTILNCSTRSFLREQHKIGVNNYSNKYFESPLIYLFYTDGRFIGPTSGHVSDGVAATSEDHKRDVEPFDIFYACPMTLDALKKVYRC